MKKIFKSTCKFESAISLLDNFYLIRCKTHNCELVIKVLGEANSFTANQMEKMAKDKKSPIFEDQGTVYQYYSDYTNFLEHVN